MAVLVTAIHAFSRWNAQWSHVDTRDKPAHDDLLNEMTQWLDPTKESPSPLAGEGRGEG